MKPNLRLTKHRVAPLANSNLKKNAQQFAITILGITICYIAAGVTAYVNIGQGPVGAFQLTMSYWTGMKMGLIAILFQGVFILGQLALERKNFQPVQCLQLLITVYGGFVLNFILYDCLKTIAISSYPLKLVFWFAALALNAFGADLILETGLIRIPCEGFIMLLAERLGVTLGKLKQIFDCLLLAAALIITLVLKLEFTVREATIINAIFFGILLDVFKQPVQKILKKNSNFP